MPVLVHAAVTAAPSQSPSQASEVSGSFRTASRGPSPAASLCNKFEALEKKWSLCNKFGDLEKKWSQFSAAAKARPKIIKLEDLEQKWAQLHAFAKHEKTMHQRKRAIQLDGQEETKESPPEEDRQDQQHNNGHKETIEPIGELRELAPDDPAPTEETQQDTVPNDTTRRVVPPEEDKRETIKGDISLVPTATETSVLTMEDTMNDTLEDESNDERKDTEERRDVWEEAWDESQEAEVEDEEPVVVEEEEEPEKHKAGFIIKRRGAKKRPRRLLALTKVRHWGIGSSRSKDFVEEEEIKSDSSGSEEVVLFGASNSPTNSPKEAPNHSLDEARDDTLCYEEDRSQRVLASMPNQELWQVYSSSRGISARHTARRGGCHEERGSSGHLVGRDQYGPLMFSSLFRRAANEQREGKKQRRSKGVSRRTGEESIRHTGECHQEGEEVDGVEAWVQEQMSLGCVSNLGSVLSYWTSTSQESSVKPDFRNILHGRLCNISAIIIQSWVRRKLARNRVLIMRAGDVSSSRRRRDLLSPTVARIQSLRKFQVVERYRKYAAVIQSAYRCWYQRNQYLLFQMATKKIQRFSLAFLVRNRRSLAASKIQRLWRAHARAQQELSSSPSFDGSGISTLSCDNSYLYENEEDVLFHNAPTYPHHDHNFLTVSPLHPPHPASPLPPRPKSNMRSRPLSVSQSPSPPPLPSPATPPTPPPASSGLPPMSPVRSRGISPLRSSRRGPTQARLGIIKSRRRRSPSPIPRPKTKKQCSLARVSPRRHNRATSPLANVMSSASEMKTAPNDRKNHQEKLRPAPIKPRKHTLNRVHDLQGKPSERHHLASTLIQKTWRGNRSEQELALMLLRRSTVVCECTNVTVSRDRLLRQKAQVMSVSKAIAQVGCLGGTERLSISKHEIIAEWKFILYINLALPEGRAVNTFSTLNVGSALQRNRRLEALSRKKLFNRTVKAALLQYLSEQQQKVSRMSLFERSLTRRRAPVAKDAAIQIQKGARRWLCLRRYASLQQCVLVIQKYVRSWQARRAHLRLESGAIRIQAFFRGELVRSIVFQYWSAAISLRFFWNQHREARLVKADALVSRIQAAFRGMKYRTKFLQRLSCAVIIQAQFRSFAAQRCFRAAQLLCRNLQLLARQRIASKLQKRKIAAVFIQRWWRFEQYSSMMRGLCATIVTTAFRRYRAFYQFRRMRDAAVTIQKFQRGYAARQQLCERRRASTEITRFFRDRIFSKRVAMCLSAATLLASWYRGTYQKRSYQRERRRFFLSNLCATQIQTQFRRHSAQSKYKQYWCATLIQAQYRSFAAQFKYQQFLWSTVTLQVQTRKLMKHKREQECKAASRIQAIWRGSFLKGNYLYLKMCMVSAQCAYRRFRQQRRYQTMRGASILIQTQWRCHCDRFNFHIHRGATIYVQRTWRQYRCMRALECQLATRLVAFTRMVLARQALKVRKSAACRIQAWQRRSSARSTFLQHRYATIQIQAFWRQSRSQAYYCLLRLLVVQLQAGFRRWKQVRTLTATKKSTLCMQKHIRSFCQKRKFLRIQKAVLKVQNQSRLWLQKRHLMALLIQAEFRRTRSQLRFNHARSSAISIQRHWRMVVARSKYQQFQEKARVIQASIRKYFRRMRHLEEVSATLLQSWYRGNITRFKFVIYQFGIVLAQSAWRTYQQRKKYLNTRKRIQYLQACYRAKRAKKEMLLAKERILSFVMRLVYRKRGLVLLAQKRKAIKVELVRTRWKGRTRKIEAARVIQHAYQKHRKIEAARVVQCWRRKIQRNRAATCIQSSCRRHICKQSFLVKKNAGRVLVVELQALLYGRRSRIRYSEVHRAVIIIQSALRAFRCRLSHLRLCERLAFLRQRADHWYMKKVQSVIIIQSEWRRCRCRVSYKELLDAVVALQSLWRSRRAQRPYSQVCQGFKILKRVARWKNKRAKLMKAVILLQCRWRMYSSKGRYNKQRHMAIVIQSQWRMQLSRGSYQRLRLRLVELYYLTRQMHWQMKATTQLATLVQRHWRTYACKKKFRKQRRLVIRIQCQWRSKTARSLFVKVRHGILSLQRLARQMWSDAKQAESALMIQKQWRGAQCRISYNEQRHLALLMQTHWRKIVAQQYYNRLMKGLRLLQKLWRRKRWNSNAVRLQTWWRVTSYHQRYRKQMEATVMIQRQWRLHSARQSYRMLRLAFSSLQVLVQKRNLRAKQMNCAMLLQQNWRRFSWEKWYKKQCNAALIVQCQWRLKYTRCNFMRLKSAVKLLQKQARHWYHQKQNWSILCQKNWRRASVRQRYRCFLGALTRAQGLWRGKQTRLWYNKTIIALLLLQRRAKGGFLQRTAAVTILQKNWRMKSTRASYKGFLSTMMTIQQRHDSLVSKRQALETLSACHIQRTFRGSRSRRSFERKVTAAVCIQSWFRSSIARFKLMIKVICATIVQSVFRGRSQRLAYANTRKSATMIAQQWRKIYLKRRYCRASTSIQVFWRKYRRRKRHVALSRRRTCKLRYTRWRSEALAQQRSIKQKHDCSLKIQQCWRMHQAHSLQIRSKQLYLLKVTAATRLQSFARMVIWRARLHQMHTSAITLQSHCRRFSSHYNHQKFLSRVISLQATARGEMSKSKSQETLIATVMLQSDARRLSQMQYQRLHHGMVTMQVHWKQIYRQKVSSATCLQRHFRMVICQSKLYQIQAAAVIVQSHWRGFVRHQTYQKFLGGMFLLQARWRVLFSLKVGSAIRVQCFTRSTMRQITFLEILIATVMLQSHARRLIEQKRYKKFHHSVVTMQIKWKQLHRMKVFSATLLQSYARVATSQSNFHQMQAAAIKVQFYWKAVAGQQAHQKFLDGIVLLQAQWKAWFHFKVRSAIQLQCFTRTTMCQLRFREMLIATVMLQSHARRLTAQMHYQRLHRGMATMQFHWKRIYRQKVSSATCLQSYFRMATCQSKLYKIHTAAAIVQSHWRGFVVHQTGQNLLCGMMSLLRRWKEHFLVKVRSAIQLQSFARTTLCRTKFQMLLIATLLLQSHARRLIAQVHYQMFHQNLTTLQIHWKKHYKSKVASATLLQSYLRRAACQSELHQTQAAATFVQSHWRSFLYHQTYQKCLRGILLVQARWKCYYLLKIRSTILLQSCVRMTTCQTKFHQMQAAVITVQSQWRRFAGYQTYQRVLCGILALQSRWKRYYLLKIRSTILLQRCVRMTTCQTKFHQMQAAVITAQSQWRRFAGYQTYQRVLCGMLELQSRWKCHCLLRHKWYAAIEIQSCWRGFAVHQTYQKSLRGKDNLRRQRREGLVVQQEQAEADLKSKFRSAVHLQSWFRQQSTRAKYLRLQSSTVLLQRNFRFRQGQLLVPAAAGRAPSTAQWARFWFFLSASALIVLPACSRTLRSSFGGGQFQQSLPQLLRRRTAESGRILETKITRGENQTGAKSLKTDTVNIEASRTYSNSTPQTIDMTPQVAFQSARTEASLDSAPRGLRPAGPVPEPRLMGETKEHHEKPEMQKRDPVNLPRVPALQPKSRTPVPPTEEFDRELQAWFIRQVYPSEHRELDDIMPLAHEEGELAFQQISLNRTPFSSAATDDGLNGTAHQRITPTSTSTKTSAPMITPKVRTSSSRAQDLATAGSNTHVGGGWHLFELVSGLFLAHGWICVWLSVIQVLGCISMYAPIGKRSVDSLKRQNRAITTLQRAFRRRQALKIWKTNLGIQKQEMQFCAKLENFERLVNQLRAQENAEKDGTWEDSIKSPVSSFPQVVVDFLGEEKAASQVQSWWRQLKMAAVTQAAIKIQTRYRSSKQRNHFIKICSAAITIKRYLSAYLLEKKKEHAFEEGLWTELLVHRLRVLSVLVIQRWFRMIAAKRRFHKMKSTGAVKVAGCSSTGGIQERDAAAYVSRWRRLRQHANHTIGMTFEEVVDELCEEQGLSRSPRPDHSLFNVSFGETSWGTDTEVAYRSGERSFCGNQMVFGIEYVPGDIVIFTETDTGVEVAVEKADIVQDAQCCGFDLKYDSRDFMCS